MATMAFLSRCLSVAVDVPSGPGAFFIGRPSSILCSSAGDRNRSPRNGRVSTLICPTANRAGVRCYDAQARSEDHQPPMMQMVDSSGDKISIDDTIRFKRWISDEPKKPSLTTLNNLARHALTAFNTMTPGCLQRTLCLSNSQAKSLKDGAQYWLPFWNVGVSWREGAGVGGALQAAALGLGGAPCHHIYPPSLCGNS
ncbi:hypothetical protein EVAR_11691_1 [Eumeta japonica]|uniref:Uncharacterized protein n=1 Tax=Eumeta variegata TaxID=151549 RepID=A0A4C1U625_EUMVA|nr:hypothetical protein EVAR_11691_1 [Eumeta japonica]